MKHLLREPFHRVMNDGGIFSLVDDLGHKRSSRKPLLIERVLKLKL